MTDEKHEHDGAQDLDCADMAQDLEIRDAEEADTVKGGYQPGGSGQPQKTINWG